MAKEFDKLLEPEKFKYNDMEFYVAKIPVFYAQRLLLASGEALKELDVSKLPESVILELLSYTAVVNPQGNPVVLDNIDIINLLVKTPSALLAIEEKVIEVNFGFFFDGSLHEVFQPLVELIKGKQP